jgi:phage I-like protein
MSARPATVPATRSDARRRPSTAAEPGARVLRDRRALQRELARRRSIASADAALACLRRAVSVAALACLRNAPHAPHAVRAALDAVDAARRALLDAQES